MPCHDYQSESVDKGLLNILTRLACAHCAHLECVNKPIPEEAKAWWKEHKQKDTERITREKKARAFDPNHPCCTDGWFHKNRRRYTDGFFCEDCGEFFHKGHPEYIRHELTSTLWMVVHNIGALATQAGKAVPPEVGPLRDRLHEAEFLEPVELAKLLKEVLTFIKAHGSTPESATMTLK